MACRRHTAILVLMITRARTCLGWAILAASLAAAVPAFAAEKKSAPKNLPGVEGDYQIVKPYVPEAEPDQAPAAKIGEWDVKVSGQLTIDVGTGRVPLPRN
jgi:hypothetical protein